MKKITFFATFLLFFFVACQPKQEADLLVINAKIYTPEISKSTAFAVKDGKFLAIGTASELQEKFIAAQTFDAQGKAIYPGFYDAHCHFYGLGSKMQIANLTGTTSFDDVLKTLQDFRAKNPNSAWLQGRGWDQNDWEIQKFPTNKKLNERFPDIPVFITRIDGHAVLVNKKALEIAKITAHQKVSGGSILTDEKGNLTGVLIDNAMEIVLPFIPNPTLKEHQQILKQAEKASFAVGLTTVTDAGLSKEIINIIDTMQQNGALQMNVYAMANPDDRAYFFKRGFIKTDQLHVRSFKIYADGALGSRGACLLSPYSDDHHNTGTLLSPKYELESMIKEMATNGFQVNAHCIGDSANKTLLDIYGKTLGTAKDKRWRIEHAQVVSKADIAKFGKFGIIPSVQPTHATSDMYWAEKRLGKDRVKTAYAYQDLLQQNKIIAFGSDFPIENVNPLYGFHAAISRQDAKGFPKGGFQSENKVARETALKAMTIWAAYANFEEKEKGSIEVGKWADFVVLEKDIMTISETETRNAKVKATFVKGKKVFSDKLK